MNTIRRTIAENLAHGNSFAPSGTHFTLSAVAPLTGKVALVTGGSEGIGYGCTHTLLSKDIEALYVLSRHSDTADGANTAIRKELGDEAARRVRWIRCDLADWAQTAKVARDIAKDAGRLDILINNAGRGIMSRQLANGVDMHMATNHFGHVVLTSHLLPLMKHTAEGRNVVRIVNAASNVHEQAPKDVRWESLEELNREYSPNQLYGRSKLAAILYTKYLSRHLREKYPRILVNATHPGIVDTRQSYEHILDGYPLGGYAMVYAPFKKDQFEGAVSAMYAATRAERSGEYICSPAIVEKGSDMANDEELGERLMKLTRDVVREKMGASLDGCPLQDF